ncbi:uncharacterized protein LOC110445110 isoform X1 [Mizuhopecten yessoensis]|uniref:uncharacterized protein LOC110445110 isoform X1 n=1 Tax=Mizuhopecten yessoensis TaxID=6573 RepID=UPI000B45A4A1|nr:uncharacterized protein LOC110445110 isoform X1 [Mizuhopecten yessoensis]
MDMSTLRTAYTMCNVLLVILGVTLLSQGTIGLPLHTEEQGPLLSLLTGKQHPDIYDRLLENYMKTLETRDEPYSGEYVVPDKRLRQGWNIAYGKRRSNKWSIAYGKRDHASPLESEGIFSDEVV